MVGYPSNADVYLVDFIISLLYKKKRDYTRDNFSGSHGITFVHCMDKITLRLKTR